MGKSTPSTQEREGIKKKKTRRINNLFGAEIAVHRVFGKFVLMPLVNPSRYSKSKRRIS